MYIDITYYISIALGSHASYADQPSDATVRTDQAPGCDLQMSSTAHISLLQPTELAHFEMRYPSSVMLRSPEIPFTELCLNKRI